MVEKTLKALRIVNKNRWCFTNDAKNSLHKVKNRFTI